MNAYITYPVRYVRTEVYDAIYDAEDRLVTFVAMSFRSSLIATRIAELLNEAKPEVV